jgi:hypothetical protein
MRRDQESRRSRSALSVPPRPCRTRHARPLHSGKGYLVQGFRRAICGDRGTRSDVDFAWSRTRSGDDEPLSFAGSLCRSPEDNPAFESVHTRAMGGELGRCIDFVGKWVAEGSCFGTELVPTIADRAGDVVGLVEVPKDGAVVELLATPCVCAGNLVGRWIPEHTGFPAAALPGGEEVVHYRVRSSPRGPVDRPVLERRAFSDAIRVGQFVAGRPQQEAVRPTQLVVLVADRPAHLVRRRPIHLTIGCGERRHLRLWLGSLGLGQ